MCADELDCITDAVGMYQTILDDDIPSAAPTTWDSPTDELRQRLPWMLAHLTPEARALLADHLGHVAELVAFVHRNDVHDSVAGSNRS